MDISLQEMDIQGIAGLPGFDFITLVFGASVRGVSQAVPGCHKMIQRGGKERGPQFFSTDIVCVFGVARLQLGLDHGWTFLVRRSWQRNFE